jgi:hypothetical protein
LFLVWIVGTTLVCGHSSLAPMLAPAYIHCLSSLGRRQPEIAEQVEANHLIIDPGLQQLTARLRE